MKILVIPDVHLKPWIFDEADYLLDHFDIDNSVFLGDLVDDWNRVDWVNLYKETIDRAILFNCMHRDSLFCYGNHEVAYLVDGHCSGNSNLTRPMIKTMLNAYERTIEPKVVHIVDNVMFSHAGVETSYDLDKINDMKLNYLYHELNSPLWSRPEPWVEYNHKYIQVVGHTPLKHIVCHENVWYTDVFSTDENNKHWGEQSFIVIDTITGDVTKYRNREKIDV